MSGQILEIYRSLASRSSAPNPGYSFPKGDLCTGRHNDVRGFVDYQLSLARAEVRDQKRSAAWYVADVDGVFAAVRKIREIGLPVSSLRDAGMLDELMKAVARERGRAAYERLFIAKPEMDKDPLFGHPRYEGVLFGPERNNKCIAKAERMFLDTPPFTAPDC